MLDGYCLFFCGGWAPWSDLLDETCLGLCCALAWLASVRTDSVPRFLTPILSAQIDSAFLGSDSDQEDPGVSDEEEGDGENDEQVEGPSNETVSNVEQDEGEANGGEVGTKPGAEMDENELMEGSMPFKRRPDSQVFVRTFDCEAVPSVVADHTLAPLG